MEADVTRGASTGSTGSRDERGQLNGADFATTKEVMQGLKELGYTQELTRTRGLAHILFMTLSIMAVPFGLATPIATSLVGGGPAVMIWGLVVVSIFSQALALSLAEICSKYPTSAGAYYWTFRLAPPRSRLLCSWINGWLTMVGVWTISLSVNFGTAQLLVAGIGIFHPEWVTTAWQTYLVFLAVTAFATGIGIFFNKLLPTIDILAAIWTLLGIIVMLVCLSAKAKAGRRPASFALGFFDPTPSGWTAGWSFFIGLLPPGRVSQSLRLWVAWLIVALAYLYSANGMITNMCEEVRDPAREVPAALAWAIPIGLASGLLFLLPIAFTLPDINTLLSVPGGQPVGVLFTTIMGSRSGGFGMVFILFIIGIFCAISICCAASRATWSFARDNAIPCSKFLSAVNHHGYFEGVPLNAYLLSTLIQALLGLIFLGSTAAFNAFVGVAVICLGASYAMPVLLSLLDGRSLIQGAPFNLGRWGFFINSFAVLWVMFEIVLFSMPAVIPVTPTSMNYASVVFVGFGVISAVWYIINGRQHYSGPPVPTDGALSNGATDGGANEPKPRPGSETIKAQEVDQI